MRREFYPPFRDEGEVVAMSGEAQLIRYLNGRIVLRGGSEQDRAEVKKWMSMFWPEALIKSGIVGPEH